VHRHRIARQRAGLVDGAERRDLLHDSRRPPKAPTGMPPPMILPSVVRSGRTPDSSCTPPRATRKPVMTSSKISSAPWRSQIARRPSRKPGTGSTMFMLPAIGSTMMQAISAPSSAKPLDLVEVVVAQRDGVLGQRGRARPARWARRG
jgi:hypothetical protein